MMEIINSLSTLIYLRADQKWSLMVELVSAVELGLGKQQSMRGPTCATVGGRCFSNSFIRDSKLSWIILYHVNFL